jgi:hypothetical protein
MAAVGRFTSVSCVAVRHTYACGALYSGEVARVTKLVAGAPNDPQGGELQARDPRAGRRSSGSTGRPEFGVGPIARVSQSPASTPGGAGGAGSMPAMPSMTRPGFGLPNLRRNVCPHFYMTGTRGAIPIQAPHLLKALIRQDTNTSRCQLRGGVHMEQGYVNDVCLTPRFNQCVFYEDELSRE